MTANQKPKSAAKRILALDYLRGFFILIIIIDHLWRWPNVFEVISGRGELWASAAEGFVIISGLLVGYVRGFKNRKLPLLTVSKTLIKRGALLYLWMLITTLALTVASWTLTFKGAVAHVPVAQYDWHSLLASALRLDYTHTLTHFLYLYAIFLVLAPIAVWLLRHRQAWIVGLLSFGLWWLGRFVNVEWLQWQMLFFVPAIAGFYLESILGWFTSLRPATQKAIRIGSVVLTLATITISMAATLPLPPGSFSSVLFSRDPLTLARAVMSFIWFIGLTNLFQYMLPVLQRWLGWLLETFGGHSLTAYILHIIPLMLCSLLFAATDNIVINSLLAAGSVLMTWAILKIPHINKFIPR